jgi:hypothetical protein
MSASLSKVLGEHGLTHLAQFKRSSRGMSRVTGFVVACSNELILLHCLDLDLFRLNGYSTIRVKDVSHYRFFDSSDCWQFRAAKLFRLVPKRPRCRKLAGVQEFLGSHIGEERLVTLHTEGLKRDACYIGPVVSVKEKTVTIEDLNCNAEWTGPRRLKLKDITKIEFGGGYEKALAKTAPVRKSPRK